MKPQTLWAGVAIIAILAAGEVTLLLNDKPAEAMLILAGLIALPLLGLGGATLYHQNEKSIAQTNGGMTRMQDELAAAHAENVRLALLVPSDAPPQIPEQRPAQQTTIILPGAGSDQGS